MQKLPEGPGTVVSARVEKGMASSQNSPEPLSVPQLFLLRLGLTAQKRWPFLGDASYTTFQILRKDVPRTRHTGSPEYGLFKATRIPPTPSLH